MPKVTETTDVSKQDVGAEGRDLDDVAPGAAMHEALMGCTPDPLFVWEPDGSLAWANTAGLVTFAMSLDPDDSSALRRSGPRHDLLPVAAALAPGATAGPAIGLVRLHGGDERWWEWTAHRDVHGRLYVSACDVTEDRRAESSAVRRLLDTVIRTSPDAVGLVGPEGQLTEVSDAAFTTLGLEAPSPIGDLFARIHHTDRPALREWLARLGAGDHVAPIRYRATHVEGRMLVFDATGRPMPVGTNLPGVMVSRDVSAVVAVETELHEAVAVAEQEQHARTELLVRMGSQLQVPLRAVMDAAGELDGVSFQPPLDVAVQHILRAGGHLADLIDEVLQVAEVDGAASSVVLQPVSLEAVVTDAMHFVRPLADRQGLRLFPSDPAGGAWPWVLADRQQLLQVLLNLLSNAIKYNRPSGSVRLSASAHGERVRLSVSDTGRGIAPEDVLKLFDPFERLGAEHSAIEGTGVGLTLTKRLVEQMGGTVEVHSVVGTGSVFVVELHTCAPSPGTGQAALPARAASLPGCRTGAGLSSAPSAPGAGAAGRSPASPPEKTGTHRRLRVLHVDDDESCAELVRHILARRAGVELHQVREGASALALARDRRVDLLLLDVGLPDVSGDIVLHELRADPTTADVPVVVVSADATDAQVARSMAAGATAYLTKPLVVAELLAVVDALSGDGDR